MKVLIAGDDPAFLFVLEDLIVEWGYEVISVADGNEAWEFEPWEMGIGINTGEVVVGNIGSEKRTKYSALGHEVNLTYRIESYAIGGQIFISESTLKKVGDIAKIHSEEKVSPKGSKQPITIYDVRGIGGKFNIDLPKKEEIFVSLLDEVPLQFAVFEDKHISEQVLRGRLLKVSDKGALIACENFSHDLMPKAMNNLKLNLFFPGKPTTDHDVYAKVLSQENNTLHVHFTSIPTEIRSRLKAMRTVC